MTFPLIKTFRATSVFKAFILNALAVAIIATLSIELRYLLENDKSQTYLFFNRLLIAKELSEIQKTLIVFTATTIFAFLAYNILYMLFEYGGGMLVSTSRVKYV